MYNARQRHRLQEADGSLESRRYFGGGQASSMRSSNPQQPRQFRTQTTNPVRQTPNPEWDQTQYQDPIFSSLLSFLNNRNLSPNYMNYANNIRNNAPKYKDQMNPTGQLYNDTTYGPNWQGSPNTAKFGTNARPSAEQIALQGFTESQSKNSQISMPNAPPDPFSWQNPNSILPTFTNPADAAGWRRDQGLPGLPIHQGF